MINLEISINKMIDLIKMRSNTHQLQVKFQENRAAFLLMKSVQDKCQPRAIHHLSKK